MKRIISVIAAVLFAFTVVFGAVFSGGKSFAGTASICAFLCCVPFFLSFENRRPNAAELVLVAVMTAFSAAGRWIFSPLPFFKPTAAIVIITGRHFGKEAGFMTGALSAVISNFWFGQGPWTPFQMLCWGLIGALSGIISRLDKSEKPIFLYIYGFLAGIIYSLGMDIWTVLSLNGGFSAELWLAAIISALPVTAVYCISNLLFLLILAKPLGKKLERIKTKYGVYE